MMGRATAAQRMLDALVAIDIQAIRAIMAEVSPGAPQLPEDQEAALLTVHTARIMADRVPDAAKRQSREWLDARPAGLVIQAVGIMVGGFHGAAKTQWDLAAQDEGAEAVSLAIRDGADLSKDAPEVSSRIVDAARRAGRPVHQVLIAGKEVGQ